MNIVPDLELCSRVPFSEILLLFYKSCLRKSTSGEIFRLLPVVIFASYIPITWRVAIVANGIVELSELLALKWHRKFEMGERFELQYGVESLRRVTKLEDGVGVRYG
ncbi:hypothetical protein E2542_SST14573 [Spatholobus suberectus]|nr:hypothetical protein E2542_SST14573 [Spatholobus suberectus]